MENKSLFIVVPGDACINNCAYCPGRIAPISGQPCLTEDSPHYSLCRADYMRRMEFARDSGCNTLIITGKCEPQQSKTFLEKIGMMNNELHKPFPIIEMQTTGTMLTKEYLFFLRANIQVTTIALTIASFDSAINGQILGLPERIKVDINSLCQTIKSLQLNLRVSINLTDSFNIYGESPNQLFEYVKKHLHADQLTLRKLNPVGDKPQSDWIKEHGASSATLSALQNHIKNNGRLLSKIEYGRDRYSLCGMSVVFDPTGLMNEDKNETYAILRSNGKLYSQWNDEGSLIF